MIKINGVEIDSTAAFSQTVIFNESYRRQTLDDVWHRQVSSIKDTLTCIFYPRTSADHDTLWELLHTTDEYTMVEYPINSTTTAIKKLMIQSISRPLNKMINGVNSFGEITVTYNER